MSPGGPADVAERLWTAMSAGDWGTASALMADGFVQEWPQSGERIVGRDDALAINRDFPGGLPAMRFRAVREGGDLAVMEVELTYADGSVYQGVSILEVRNEHVEKETDYFAEPFPAPGWRAQWVERFTP